MAYESLLNVLHERGKLSQNELKKVERVKKTAGSESLPQLLVKLGVCSELDVADAYVESGQFEKIAAEQYPLERQLPENISLRFLKQYHVIGLSDDDAIEVAMMDPEDQFVVDALQLATGKHVTPKVGLLSEIDAALDIQYGEGRSQVDKIVDDLDLDDIADEDLEHLKDLASEAPIIKMVNLIMQRAIETRASDIHIEPFEQSLKVRLRVDGVLKAIDAPSVKSTAAVISRIKIMAKLNIAERRLPQDGRIKIQMLGKELDLRVSTIPTMYGESVVIRLLDKDNTVLDFAALGFAGKHLDQFLDALSQPHGIILITGPTGSGKSTTMYAALKQLNTSERKIITVEDPVEYQMEGINQIQAKPQIGLTFAAALRSIVRQDPDVIMIGEMRDLETARIAVQSALTGHLVLSTLHTNDAAGGVTRLLDMGLEEYLLTSTVNGILAQRLVRKLCPVCKQAYHPPAELIEDLQFRRFVPAGDIVFYKPVGCSLCSDMGYRGRLAIIEFLPMTDPIRKLIMTHAEAGIIQKLAIAEGMSTMYENGLVKVAQGITTLEEVLRVTTAES
ncbi:MAG: type II secretion system ATPase GspE [Methylococcaceae bacterium]|nr:type II secretion system ATPase GspE [Methylococcaceae bacterium]MDZ4156597.1 type II secretion system ATPase GspE [Methylococcales bacterium]MDP2394747.1 type II secretion system ATPase GspE [Methylococcaceae bacterium]MDP3020169.1 type II secretion system ATPase GspE [Methylococcaceae bacterium]MDP3390709.1 type II secretion system ATPase GspE [Methylococcaceae bacterium]